MSEHDEAIKQDTAAGHDPAATPESPAATAQATESLGADAPAGPAAAGHDADAVQGDAASAGASSAEAGAGAQAPVDGSDVEADLEALRARAAERDEYLALAQRAQADFDNYRRRMARETAQAMDRGASKLAKELLPALDHLELALKAAEAEGGELFKGVRMVQGELLGALNRVGIEAFSPTGERFDPNEHEAMVQRPAEGVESGTVVEVYQQGYRINGLVLRPARVVVAA